MQFMLISLGQLINRNRAFSTSEIKFQRKLARKHVAMLSKNVLIVLKFKVDILNNCKF